MNPRKSTRHAALLSAWSRFEKAATLCALRRCEAEALYEQYPAPEYNDLAGGRMRANNLTRQAQNGMTLAHSEFIKAVRCVGGTHASAEFLPPRAYRVVLPRYKNFVDCEQIMFGALPSDVPVSYEYQLAQARSQIADWPWAVRQALLKTPYL